MNRFVSAALSFVLGMGVSAWMLRDVQSPKPPTDVSAPAPLAEPQVARATHGEFAVEPLRSVSTRAPLPATPAADPGDAPEIVVDSPDATAAEECAELARRLTVAHEQLHAARIRAQRHEKDLRRYRSKLQIGRGKIERALGDDAFVYPEEVLVFAGDIWDMELAPLELSQEDAEWLCVNQWHGTWPAVDLAGDPDYAQSIVDRWGAERLAAEVDAQNLYHLIGWLPTSYAAREFGPYAGEIHDRLTEGQQPFFRAFVGLDLAH